MSNLKDKLSANVRRARAAQAPVADKTAEEQPSPTKPADTQNDTDKRTADEAVATPPTRPTTGKPAVQQAQTRAPTRSANFVEESGSTLFPDRVWPD